MRIRLLALSAPALICAAALQAQQNEPTYFQVMNCVKVVPGKTSDFRQLVNEVSKPLAEMRLKSGEILTWSLLRNVMPAGTEARCDFTFSTIYAGVPPAPAGREDLVAAIKKAGIKTTAADYIAKRDAISKLVATEMWRVRVRSGQPKVGNYVYLNHMKVHNAADYIKFETEVWKPLAEQWIQSGAQTGWLFSTAVLPTGTDTKYMAYSADIYPDWKSAFAARNTEETFKKAHPGKDYAQTMGGLGKLRDLAQRELLVIEQRVSK